MATTSKMAAILIKRNWQFETKQLFAWRYTFVGATKWRVISFYWFSYYITVEAELHLKLLLELCPEWVSMVETARKGKYIRVDKNKDTADMLQICPVRCDEQPDRDADKTSLPGSPVSAASTGEFQNFLLPSCKDLIWHASLDRLSFISDKITLCRLCWRIGRMDNDAVSIVLIT
jgi:hypothetical protein